MENNKIVQKRRIKMDSNRKIAIIVGVLFITATVSSLLSGVFSGSISDPDYLTAVSANENQVLIGVLFQLILTASVVAIPIMMFPILKKHNESLALGYVGARIFEGFFIKLYPNQPNQNVCACYCIATVTKLNN
jgi:hypothetical protein